MHKRHGQYCWPGAGALALASIGIGSLALSGCNGGSGGGGGGGAPSEISTPEGTVALGDAGYQDLSGLQITFHNLALLGGGQTAFIVEEGVDAPVGLDALAYHDTAAPIASRTIPAGSYDTLTFKITISALDLDGADVPVYPIFDPQGGLYTEIETTFPLGPNAFSVAAPAEEHQPLLFLHIDAEHSIQQGEIDGSVVMAPQIFLSTHTPMDLIGTVTLIDAEAGLFQVEDAEGALFVVEPTSCTCFVSGFAPGEAGVGPAVVYANLVEGDVVQMEGELGIDPGCEDEGQRAVFYHPHFLRTQFDVSGVAIVHGVISSVIDTPEGTDVTLAVVFASDASESGPIPGVLPGDVFQADFGAAQIFSGRGELHDLTGLTDKLQVGEVIGVGVTDFTVAPGQCSGSPQIGFLRLSHLSGMVKDVAPGYFVLHGNSSKKGGDPYPAKAFSQKGEADPVEVDLGADTFLNVGPATRIQVGPSDGWSLPQVLDPWYDNQIRGPEGEDGQQLGFGCADEASVDRDVDAAALTAFVDHRADGSNPWVIQRLVAGVSADSTQKYVAYYPGLPSCTSPANGAQVNNPCIEISGLHREKLVLGDSREPTWRNLAQTGAGLFGTAVLNAGALVPGASVPAGSDTAGWDDVEERVLLGIDFDGDMYPFDDTTDSCVGMSERVWVDLSKAQFFYFAKDPVTSAVDMQYLSTYAAFKAKVIELQAAMQGQACGPGFHENAGFGFTGLIDKQSIVPDGGGEVVPVMHAIDGKVFNGGCVPDVN